MTNAAAPGARRLLVGVDVGGTTTEAHLVATGTGGGGLTAGSIVASATRPTDTSGPEPVVATAAAAIVDLLARGGLSPAEIGGIGVGIAGHVDPASGTVRNALNLGIGADPFPFRDALRARLELPVAVDNDVRTAALGAFHHLRRAGGPDLRSLVFLNIGTGISAAAILDGRLHRGRNNIAGEIGHLPVAPEGRRCRCGMVGCLESVAAGPAVRRAWPKGAADLFTAAGAGDPAATPVAEGIAASLAQAVMWLMAAYDPDLVVLGGGVGSASPLTADMVSDALGALAAGSELASQTFSGERLLTLDPDLPVGALGAASLVLELISLPSGPRHDEQATLEEEQP
jgi:predicted NBD/HSP70 family sugar kinase